MARVIRVKYENGVLKLLDEVRLRDGEELEIMIIRRRFSGFSERLGKYVFRVDRDVVGEFCSRRK